MTVLTQTEIAALLAQVKAHQANATVGTAPLVIEAYLSRGLTLTVHVGEPKVRASEVRAEEERNG